MLPYDDGQSGDALLDHGTSPTSAGLPPPANTGASLPGLPPPGQQGGTGGMQGGPGGQQPQLDLMSMLQGGGAVQGRAPMPMPTGGAAGMDQDSPQLGGGGLLSPAHGQALREMAKKLGSLRQR